MKRETGNILLDEILDATDTGYEVFIHKPAIETMDSISVRVSDYNKVPSKHCEYTCNVDKNVVGNVTYHLNEMVEKLRSDVS